MMRIYGFEPIADEHSEILILGSMPSVTSLDKQEYYGFSRNAFWRVMFALFEERYSNDYEEKKALLRRHRVALWDVIASCERQGSADAKIKDVRVNDFEGFFYSHPKICCVCFNGKTAYNTYKRHVGMTGNSMAYCVLGSTSPAHAISFEKRIANWKQIRGRGDGNEFLP